MESDKMCDLCKGTGKILLLFSEVDCECKLKDNYEEKWKEEIDKREKQLEEGTLETIPWEKVKETIKEKRKNNTDKKLEKHINICKNYINKSGMQKLYMQKSEKSNLDNSVLKNLDQQTLLLLLSTVAFNFFRNEKE